MGRRQNGKWAQGAPVKGYGKVLRSIYSGLRSGWAWNSEGPLMKQHKPNKRWGQATKKGARKRALIEELKRNGWACRTTGACVAGRSAWTLGS